MFRTGLGELLHGVGLNLGITIYSDDSCDGDRVSLAVPQVNICGAGTGEVVCTK